MPLGFHFPPLLGEIGWHLARRKRQHSHPQCAHCLAIVPTVSPWYPPGMGLPVNIDLLLALLPKTGWAKFWGIVSRLFMSITKQSRLFGGLDAGVLLMHPSSPCLSAPSVCMQSPTVSHLCAANPTCAPISLQLWSRCWRCGMHEALGGCCGAPLKFPGSAWPWLKACTLAAALPSLMPRSRAVRAWDIARSASVPKGWRGMGATGAWENGGRWGHAQVGEKGGGHTSPPCRSNSSRADGVLLGASALPNDGLASFPSSTHSAGTPSTCSPPRHRLLPVRPYMKDPSWGNNGGGPRGPSHSRARARAHTVASIPHNRHLCPNDRHLCPNDRHLCPNDRYLCPNT